MKSKTTWYGWSRQAGDEGIVLACKSPVVSSSHWIPHTLLKDIQNGRDNMVHRVLFPGKKISKDTKQ